MVLECVLFLATDQLCMFFVAFVHPFNNILLPAPTLLPF